MITLENTTVNEVELETFDLIKGDFSVSEATEIIDELFQTKIRFHELKNFGIQERFGETDPHTDQRIDELKSHKEKALALILQAKNTGQNLKVNSTVSIELV